MAKLVAITGQMRSGKDTFADYLVDNNDFQKFAFGNGIKRTCQMIVPAMFAEGKPRELLVDIGQGFRKHDPDVWVRYVERELAVTTDHDTGIVISDFRQQNEYDWARKHGFTVVRINSSLENRIARMKERGDQYTDADLDNPLETALLNWAVDYDVQNDGTVEELQQQAATLFASFPDVRNPFMGGS